MPRKTVSVAYIVEKGNHFLRESEDEQRHERIGVASMIELALHAADAYAGYLHLESAEVRHDDWHGAWERIRTQGPHGSEDLPEWDDYCKDDTRRAYLLKGAAYPRTSRIREVH